MVSYINMLKVLVPFFVMLAIILGFHYSESIYFKYLPASINFILFIILFFSLFGEKTIIQYFLLKNNPNADKNMMYYTKNLTYLWSLFFFGNFIISLATVSLTKKIWIIYNGVIYFVFIVAFIGIETLVKIILEQKHNKIDKIKDQE